MRERANARTRDEIPDANKSMRSIAHRPPSRNRALLPSVPSFLPSVLRAITSISQPSVNAPRARERDTHIDRSRLVEKSARRDPPETCIVVESSPSSRSSSSSSFLSLSLSLSLSPTSARLDVTSLIPRSQSFKPPHPPSLVASRRSSSTAHAWTHRERDTLTDHDSWKNRERERHTH